MCICGQIEMGVKKVNIGIKFRTLIKVYLKNMTMMPGGQYHIAMSYYVGVIGRRGNKKNKGGPCVSTQNNQKGYILICCT